MLLVRKLLISRVAKFAKITRKAEMSAREYTVNANGRRLRAASRARQFPAFNPATASPTERHVRDPRLGRTVGQSPKPSARIYACGQISNYAKSSVQKLNRATALSLVLLLSPFVSRRKLQLQSLLSRKNPPKPTADAIGRSTANERLRIESMKATIRFYCLIQP